jgi:hypothetical protein
MSMSISSSGSFKNLDGWFARMKRMRRIEDALHTYGVQGVDALSNATPRESGLTAESWQYRIRTDKVGWTIEWFNTHIVDGRPIAILLQYGHATGTGGYVVGRDYINPAMRPIFDKMADDMWKEVTK